MFDEVFSFSIDFGAGQFQFSIYLLFYVVFNSQGHISTGSLQVEETSAYCTVRDRASVSNYQISNMKRPARDSNRRPQRLEARTLTATPPSPLEQVKQLNLVFKCTMVLCLFKLKFLAKAFWQIPHT